MSDAGFFVLAAGVAVIGLVVWLALRSPRDDETDTSEPSEGGGGSLTIEPPVTLVELEDDDVVVEFAVPLSEEKDDRLHEILMSSAVEAIRKRRQFDVHLASGRLNRIVVRSGRDAVQHIGHIELADGMLPPPVEDVAFEIATGAAPLLEHASGEAEGPADFGPDELPSIGSELGLSPEVMTALRAQGLHPTEDDAPELVRGLLKTAGYAIEDLDDETYLALRGGDTVYVRSVPHADGDHPELSEADVEAFLFGLAKSSASEGILVSSKLVPFHLYDREHERARLLGRQRLPGFTRSMFRR